MARRHLSAGNRAGFTVLASSISAIVGAGGMQAAHAQDEESASTEEVLLITGSRIQRRDLSAPSPIMTIEAARLDMSSTISVESVLNQMPQFVPDQDQFDAQGNIQTSPTSSLGIGTVSLRGVQSNRTLVLLDGRRAQPTNAALVVDLNSIPAAAIERIETITGGASSVYGADALAGVVNFVIRDDFEGISIDVQTGFTDAGDGEETRFTSLLGMNSDSGSANAMLGVEWYERDVAFQKNRDFYVDGWYDPTNNLTTFFPSMAGYAPGANLPDQAVVDSLFGPGVVNVNTPGLQFFFNPDGTPFVRIGNTAPGFDNSLLGLGYSGDGDYGLIREPAGAIEQVYMEGALATPMQRRSAFGKAHVDLDDNLRAFVQANFSRSEVDTYSAGPPPAVGGAWGASIPNDGRTAIPQALQDLLDSRTTDPTANWQLNRGLDFLGQFGPENTTDLYQIMAGFEGSFENRDWTWEAYVSSGQTDVQNLYVSMPSVDKWQALAALPEFGAGAVQAFPDVFGYGINCTSGLPIFDGTTATTTNDCVQSLLSQYKTTTVVDQDILEANLQGKLADLAAGELRFAAGISTRENSYDYSPASPQSAVFDRPLGIFPSNAAAGKTSVDEIYGELLLPVVERLSLELGYRYSDYDTAAGSVGTYKALFDWSATNWMRLRGGYQRANRAPNSAELFQSGVVVFSTGFVGDPCQTNTNAPWGNRADNTTTRAQVQQLCFELINDPTVFGPPGSALADNFIIGSPGDPPFTGINGIQAGNDELESEEADTYTIGLVFQGPGELDGVTASLDYYSIEINGAIATFSANTVYEQCFNANGISNPGYSVSDPLGFCGLISRGQAGATGTVDLTYLNTGFIETAGIDLAVNWATDLSTGGTFFVNSNVSFLDKFNTQEKPGDPVREWKDSLGQGGQYKFRLNTTFGYNFAGGNANIGLRLRHLPAIRSADVVMVPNTATLATESHNNVDLFAGYTFNDRYQLRGGIDNVLDEDPAIVGATPTDSNSNSTLPSYYDVLGRRMYIGIKMLF